MPIFNKNKKITSSKSVPPGHGGVARIGKKTRAAEVKDEIDLNLRLCQDEYHKEESIPVNWKRVKKMGVILSIMFFEQIVRGSSLISSLLGIKR